MTEKTSILAKPRTVIGKANRRLAESGQIPAVLYGGGRDPMALAIDRHDFERFVAHHAAGSTLIALSIEGESKPVNAMIKELQTSPVKGNVLHVDFLAVRMDVKIQATVAVHTEGESPGVKAGGILMTGLHSLTAEALPSDLPDALVADVSSLEIGDTLLVGDITPPEGVTIVEDPESVVCSVTLPKVVEEEVEEEVLEGEEVEPELVGEEGVEGEPEETEE
ncbi:MAG: 50S ribosomal protein L25 [Coriobacteriia bacterium]|nr:50S ribosomal protein L25 [Coriobacteriia bacterium]